MEPNNQNTSEGYTSEKPEGVNEVVNKKNNWNNVGSSMKDNKALVLILALVLIFVVIFAGLLKLSKKANLPSAANQPAVDINGVPIINLDKNGVLDVTGRGTPLDEAHVHAVFRWAVEHPEEAARLSPEEKANIIRSLNE
jgi:hypothetical protein